MIFLILILVGLGLVLLEKKMGRVCNGIHRRWESFEIIFRVTVKRKNTAPFQSQKSAPDVARFIKQ